MGTIVVVHDELNSLELSIFKKDDRSKPELRYFPKLTSITTEGNYSDGTFSHPHHIVLESMRLV